MAITAPAMISKARFKAQLLELLRQVETSGRDLIVSDHGRPAIRVSAYRPDGAISDLQTTWARRVAEGEVSYDAAQAVAPLPPEAWGDLA